MKLELSLGNLAKKLDRLDPEPFSSNNKTGLRYWKDNPVIPIDEWINFRDTPYALDYFPDDFRQGLTNIPEIELENGQERREDIEKWNSDFIELMEQTRNPNYGRVKCFHCLLNPAENDPIFIGINRLVAKGLVNRKQDPPQYPCEVVNRFQCPYEKAVNSAFDVEDLFKLEEMAFALEISLAKARKEDSRIRVGNKEELLHALTDKKTLTKILAQGSEALEVSECVRKYLAENRDKILDYFMKINDEVNLEELRFY